MATATIIIPPINVIRFVDMGKVLPAAYNQKHFDDFWLSDSLLPFQEDPVYQCKAQYKDTNWVQVHHNGTHSSDLFLVDSFGKKITPFTIFRSHLDFAGNVWDEYGTISPIALHTSTFRVIWDDGLLVDGKTYHLQLEVYYSSDKTVKAICISEPILYKYKHLNTVCIDITHRKNEYGIFWSYINTIVPAASWVIINRLRLDGYIDEFEPQSQDTFFEDQQIDLRMIDSKPYRKMKLFVGDMYGVSDYNIDKLNRAFACSTKLIDGKQFEKEEGATIDISRVNQNALKRAEVEIREYRTAGAGLFKVYYDAPPIIDTDPLPGGGSGVLTMGLLSGKKVALTGPYILDNSDAFDAYAAILTSVISAEIEVEEDVFVATYPLGLYGDFTYDEETGMRYNIHESDLYEPTFEFQLLPLYIEFTVVIATQDTPFTFQFIAGTHIVEWGDGDIENVNYTALGNQFQTVTHEYGVGTFTVRIYHDNSGMEQFKLEDNGLVTNVSDKFPLIVDRVELKGTAIVDIDMQAFVNNAGYLKELTVKDGELESIDTSAFDPQIWKAGIRKIDFSGNKLSASEIDNYINEFVDNVVYVANGTMNFSGQTPLAEPTAASEESRQKLLDVGWNLSFDEEQ